MIKQAKFVTSIADASALKDMGRREIAIAGKSNVGKSSFINMLVNQNKLAKTSSAPGRTRLINYFEINNGEFYLVDLPGYGFAKVSRSEKQKWGGLIESYLRSSTRLINVFVLVDIRRVPDGDDAMLLDYLYAYGIPFTVIATKADKLSRQQQTLAKRNIAAALKIGTGDIIVTSSNTRLGKEDVFKRIAQLLENSEIGDEME